MASAARRGAVRSQGFVCGPCTPRYSRQMLLRPASTAISRRTLLTAAASTAIAATAPAFAARHGGARYTLTAQPGKATLRGLAKPETDIWGFEGQTPGPVLRVRQGERLDVKLLNRLAQPTT